MNVPNNNQQITYCYADYLNWPSEERVELIAGRKYALEHHDAVAEAMLDTLHEALYEFMRGYSGKTSCQPFDLRLPENTHSDADITTVLQPDLCVICQPSILDERGCVGAPDIVVAMLTPANAAVTLHEKYQLYERAGVKEYWIVSPHDHTFTAYVLHNGAYQAQRLLTHGDTITTAVLPGFSLALTSVFTPPNSSEE
ncbi:MAG: Uma2 family endonuclease [Chitinophagia bacterium]|nr:Uma2 family endonuclease [Chitinophagia bacterium]